MILDAPPVPTLFLPSGAGDDDSGGDSGDQSIKLNVGGEAVKMEQIGPVIVNVDGTMRRIANWDLLTQTEREWSWRVIPERNKKRLAKLRARLEEQKTDEVAVADATAGVTPGTPGIDTGEEGGGEVVEVPDV